VDVETIDEAIAIAQSSPGLAYGGSIEVRPVAENVRLTLGNANWRAKNNLQPFRFNNI
jgi:hypothetical protein